MARQNFSAEVEKALNDQLNLEFKASHIYLSMSAYFGRDSVALPGFQKFFKHSSDEEREHGEKFIDYVNKRGGRVVLSSVPAPEIEWNSGRSAVEIALQLEKDVNTSLLKLHKVAEEQNDPATMDFLEGEYLKEQVEANKQLSDMLTQIARVGGDGLGLYLFDQNLQSEK
ncbi:ferritin-like superfamily [Cladochytrium replicatum]|nr:ferritin-like superfamily [Cladochytrium replicatum]